VDVMRNKSGAGCRSDTNFLSRDRTAGRRWYRRRFTAAARAGRCFRKQSFAAVVESGRREPAAARSAFWIWFEAAHVIEPTIPGYYRRWRYGAVAPLPAPLPVRQLDAKTKAAKRLANPGKRSGSLGSSGRVSCLKANSPRGLAKPQCSEGGARPGGLPPSRATPSHPRARVSPRETAGFSLSKRAFVSAPKP
jgi:hypothetical protein